MKEVWKLQRPLATNNSEAIMLCYTKDKKKVAMTPIATEDLYLLFGELPKIFVRAEINPQGILEIGDRVTDRSW